MTGNLDEELAREVWKATVDEGRFTSTVTQVGDDPYRGQLRVRVNGSDEELLSQEVPVSFGAQFGPDVADVWTWQDMSIEVIDRWIAEQKRQKRRRG